MPYNQPKLSSTVWWNPNSTTFANDLHLSSGGNNLFINRDNIVYVTDYRSKQINLWHPNGTVKTTIGWDSSFMPRSMFVAIDGNIYISDFLAKKVEKWSLNGSKDIVVASPYLDCYGLFVDIDNYLYCSVTFEHRVVKMSLDDETKTIITVAGNKSEGSAPNMLNQPYGILVDINFTLYVSDCKNNRVQRFEPNQQNGITVAGNIKTQSIIFKCPIAIFLDADGNLFIVDRDASCVIRSINHELYSFTGCSDTSDTSPNRLLDPITAAFDSYGNIFVADKNKGWIQKFTLMVDTSGK